MQCLSVMRSVTAQPQREESNPLVSPDSSPKTGTTAGWKKSRAQGGPLQTGQEVAVPALKSCCFAVPLGGAEIVHSTCFFYLTSIQFSCCC